MACTDDPHHNIEQAMYWVRQASDAGAQLVLLQELFETPYFCQTKQDVPPYSPHLLTQHATIQRFASLARERSIVVPISFYEKGAHGYYNSVAVIDATGELLGCYRKSHIPDGPGYEEKHYFQEGDTGFRVWDTAIGRIGIGICWDQWFPEAARCMALLGAELLLYPTAIGNEPPRPDIDAQPHWTTVMCGHAAANMIPVLASNRIGIETASDGSFIRFFGRSFICDHRGQLVVQLDRTTPGFGLSTFALDAMAVDREQWGLFRDRRPDLYASLVDSSLPSTGFFA